MGGQILEAVHAARALHASLARSHDVFELRKALPAALIAEEAREVAYRPRDIALQLGTQRAKAELARNGFREDAVRTERAQHATQRSSVRPCSFGKRFGGDCTGGD